MIVAFERDADDLRLIMQHYLDAGNQDRIYSEQGDCSDLLNEEFDYERASARILGHDVGRLLTDTSQLGANALAMAMIRKEGGTMATPTLPSHCWWRCKRVFQRLGGPRCVLIRRV
jgi:hypothetical protein